MREAPARIEHLASTLQRESAHIPVQSAYKKRLGAFAFAAVQDVFDAVIDQWLRGGIRATEIEPPKHHDPAPQPNNPSPPESDIVIDDSAPTLVEHFLSIAPSKSSCRPDPTATLGQVEVRNGASGALDHVLPSVMEGTKAWTGIEEPSGLDWLSMVANMDSTSWDDYLMTV